MSLVGPQDYLKFLDDVASHLDRKFVSDAQVVEHGQWELPFEAVLLALLQIDPSNLKIDYSLAHALAEEAGIVSEGVLDADTWDRFKNWVENVEKS